MRKVATGICLALLAAPGQAGPLDTPDLTPYDPVEVLCTHGKTVSPWCKDWMMCIKGKANPAQTPEAVMSAWDPADCKEICGSWPNMTPKEGAKKSFLQLFNPSKAIAGLLHLDSSSSNDCLKSCGNFQKSLSSGVSKIMFEPGKVAAMGLPKQGGKAPAEICTKKDSPCMPDLPIKAQKCMGHKTKKVLDKSYDIPAEVEQGCKFIKMNMEDCKKCPQVQGGSLSEYAAFTGGCMDQLNAYWQATHPKAGEAAIPGAKGCTVH